MELPDRHNIYNEATTSNTQTCNAEDNTRTIENEEERRSANIDEEIENSNPVKNTSTRNTKKRLVQQKKELKKRPVDSQRLENTIAYTNDLVRLTTDDQNIRKQYYKRKLKLLKKDINIKDRIANALENIMNLYSFAQN